MRSSGQRSYHTRTIYLSIINDIFTTSNKGRTIRKNKGGGGAKYKEIFAKGKLNEKKNHAHQLILKKYSCYGLKKIHTRNLVTKKIPAARKSPPPPP